MRSTRQEIELTGTQVSKKEYDYHIVNQDFSDATPLLNELLDNRVRKLIFEYSTRRSSKYSDLINNQNAIADALQQNTSLESLTLQCAYLDKSLADIVGALKCHPLLRSLTLRNYNGDVINKNLTTNLAALLKENEALKELELRFISFDMDITTLTKAIAESPYLETLNISNVTLSMNDRLKLFQALRDNKSITKIVCNKSDEKLYNEIEKIVQAKRERSPRKKVVEKKRISIKDLDAVDVLTNLYLFSISRTPTERVGRDPQQIRQEAHKLISESPYIDNMFGVPINVDFSKSDIDPEKFDSYAGLGSVALVVKSIREALEDLHRPRFFLFDRDDTLINEEQKIINPSKMISMMRAISETPECEIGIVSHGGITKEHDPALIAFNATGVMKKNIAYAQYGSTTFVNSLVGVEGIEFDETDPIKRARDSFNSAEAQISGMPEDPGVQLDEDGLWKIKNGSQRKNDGREIVICPETLWTIQIGQTFIKIRAKEYLENYVNYVKSDSKIAAVFQNLDQAHLKVRVTPALRALGFVSIRTPAHYKEIDSKDVIFIDDKPSSCAYIRSAGFTAIDADTACSEKHKNELVHDTYVPKLFELIPDSAKEKYKSYQPEDEKRQELIDDLQKYIDRINPNKDKDLSRIDFKAGFFFLPASRAVNRKANYQLALHLRDKLINRHNPIEEIFNNEKMEELRVQFGRTRKINSNELNNIIKKEHEIAASFRVR